ncbi:MAG: peptidoglycan-binding protein, partial [Halocynthiibacter sp.]
MPLPRRSGQRFQASIWPGFVDAMTALLLVLMFVLTIFMIVQFVLRETITGQESELDQLSAQVQSLADALGLEQSRARGLQAEVGRLGVTLQGAQSEAEVQAALIASLNAQTAVQTENLATQRARITSFEAQVATLLADRDAARGEGIALRGELEALAAEQTTLLSEQEALQLALAQARNEIDVGVETARLAGARREALAALVADLRRRESESDAQNTALLTEVENLDVALSAEESARLVESAAAEALRERLLSANTELTAMTLQLEAQRARAEETLTLLAAANAARAGLDSRLAEA